MNSVRLLTVKSAMRGDRVQCSFLSDRSLSNYTLHIEVKGCNITHMNGVRLLTVKSAMRVDRVQCSFLSDRSLSNHTLHIEVKG